MDREELRLRTKRYAVAILKFCNALPRTPTLDTISRQLTKAGTAIGANYSATCRSRSTAEFVARMGIVMEEADESGYWLDILDGSGLSADRRLQELLSEAHELSAIFSASYQTARRRREG